MTQTSWRRRVFAALVASLLCVAAAGAQTNTAEIAGVVTDSSGGVLPGALVTARHEASGALVERVTDAEGRFFLPALRIGHWELTARLTGLAPQTRIVVLELGRTVNLEFALGVQGLAEQIVVGATRRCCRPPPPRSATSSKTARFYVIFPDARQALAGRLPHQRRQALPDANQSP